MRTPIAAFLLLAAHPTLAAAQGGPPAPAPVPVTPPETTAAPAATAPAATAADASVAWPKITVSPGLQMWRAIAAAEDGSIQNPNLIGLVVKAQMTLTDMIAVHARGAYGFSSTDSPILKQATSAWMAGVGFDMYFALGRKVIWYNTMGIGFQQAKLDETKPVVKKHPTTNNPGAYFVTTLDITMGKGVGMWMDWGCGVVGPAFADSAAGKVDTWHINPLGAGGFRFSF